MTAVLIALLVAGTVAVLVLRRFVPGWGHHSNSSHDVGTVSQSWLTEHRAAHKDRFE